MKTVERHFVDKQLEQTEQVDQLFLPPWLSRTVLFCSSYSEWLAKGG